MENDAKISLSADISNFQQQLKIATGSLAKFQTDAGRVTSGLKSAFAALGVGLSVNAFSEMLKGTIEAADRLGKLSQSVGISVESLSALKYSAGLSDISLEQLGKGLEKLSKNMLSVEQGSGSAVSAIEGLGVTAKGGAAAAFAQLNINVEQSKGHLKSSESVMLEVADKFEGMKDGAVKTAVAMQIFGKSGAELIPLLNQGSAAIEAQRQEAALRHCDFHRHGKSSGGI